MFCGLPLLLPNAWKGQAVDREQSDYEERINSERQEYSFQVPRAFPSPKKRCGKEDQGRR